jgi:hypothetical protein
MKCFRKPKGQTRMYNPYTLATQDIGQRQIKQKKNTMHCGRLSNQLFSLNVGIQDLVIFL